MMSSLNLQLSAALYRTKFCSSIGVSIPLKTFNEIIILNITNIDTFIIRLWIMYTEFSQEHID